MSSFQSFSFAGKKALVRVDFNVPLNEQFQITDDTRMRATVKTINKIFVTRRFRHSSLNYHRILQHSIHQALRVFLHCGIHHNFLTFRETFGHTSYMGNRTEF